MSGDRRLANLIANLSAQEPRKRANAVWAVRGMLRDGGPCEEALLRDVSVINRILNMISDPTYDIDPDALAQRPVTRRAIVGAFFAAGEWLWALSNSELEVPDDVRLDPPNEYTMDPIDWLYDLAHKWWGLGYQDIDGSIEYAAKFAEFLANDLGRTLSDMDVAIDPDQDLHFQQWGRLRIQLANTGGRPATAVSLRAGRELLRMEANILEAERIDSGETRVIELPLQPQAAGNVPFDLSVKWEDIFRGGWGAQPPNPTWDTLNFGTSEKAFRLFVRVQSERQARMVVQGNYHAGPVDQSQKIVHGDTVEINRRSTPAQEPRPFVVCPYCGEDLNLPKTRDSAPSAGRD